MNNLTVYTNKDGTPNIIGFDGKYEIIKTYPSSYSDELMVLIYTRVEEENGFTYKPNQRVPNNVMIDTMKKYLILLSKEKHFKLEVVPPSEENDKTKFILTKNQRNGIEKMLKRTNRRRSFFRLESILENGEYNNVDRYLLNYYRDLYNKHFKDNEELNEIDFV